MGDDAAAQGGANGQQQTGETGQRANAGSQPCRLAEGKIPASLAHVPQRPQEPQRAHQRRPQNRAAEEGNTTDEEGLARLDAKNLAAGRAAAAEYGKLSLHLLHGEGGNHNHVIKGQKHDFRREQEQRRAHRF